MNFPLSVFNGLHVISVKALTKKALLIDLGLNCAIKNQRVTFFTDLKVNQYKNVYFGYHPYLTPNRVILLSRDPFKTEHRL